MLPGKRATPSDATPELGNAGSQKPEARSQTVYRLALEAAALRSQGPNGFPDLRVNVSRDSQQLARAGMSSSRTRDQKQLRSSCNCRFTVPVIVRPRIKHRVGIRDPSHWSIRELGDESGGRGALFFLLFFSFWLALNTPSRSGAGIYREGNLNSRNENRLDPVCLRPCNYRPPRTIG
jgi:hypothetical protein